LSGSRKILWIRASVFALVLPGLLGLPGPALAGEGDAGQMTNVQLVEESIRGAVAEALSTFPKGQTAARVIPLGKSDVNALVEAILVEEMTSRNLPIDVPPEEEAAVIANAVGPGDSAAIVDPGAIGDSPGPLLFYRVNDFSFRYADIFRRMVIGPKRVRRLARTDLHLRLSDPGGQTIVWSQNVSHSAVDVVPYGDVDALETTTYAWGHPERRPSTLSRLYEPLIVAGIVGGLVFLFYSNQSGD
jgi:hypothetical protein